MRFASTNEALSTFNRGQTAVNIDSIRSDLTMNTKYLRQLPPLALSPMEKPIGVIKKTDFSTYQEPHKLQRQNPVIFDHNEVFLKYPSYLKTK